MSGATSQDAFPDEVRLAGEGDSDCVVVREAGGAVVRKTFLPTARQDARQAAQREFRYLQRLRGALADVEGVTCPEPLAVALDPVAEVRMAACPGVPVDRYLRGRQATDAVLGELAERMAAALRVYVAVFEEPHYDFFYRNMLYDEDSDVLSLVDMGIPAGLPELMAGLPPLAASLGTFVGHVLRDIVRPRRIAAVRGHRRIVRLTRGLVHGALERDGGRRSVRVAALRSYRRTTGTAADRAASPAKRAWYRAAELLLARPVLAFVLAPHGRESAPAAS